MSLLVKSDKDLVKMGHDTSVVSHSALGRVVSRNGCVLARPRSGASLSQRGECPKPGSFVCLLRARGLLLMSCPLNT